MAEGCGNCLFHGTSKIIVNEGVKVFCLLHIGEWYKEAYKCDGYIKYIEMPLPERARIASDLRSEIEGKKKHKEILGVANRANGISEESNDISRSAKRAAWVAIVISIGAALVAIFKK